MEHDIDQNGFLDKIEAKVFMDELASVVEADRAKNYNEENFASLFEKFDEDGN